MDSVIKLAEFNVPCYKSRYHNADVLAVGKKDLKKGDILGGIGSNDIYGEVDTIENMDKGNYLSVSECNGSVLICDIEKDEPITGDMIWI